MAFSGTGHRLGDGDPIVLSDTESAAPVSTSHIGTIPSLKDICLSTLDRYIDLLEDIGTTPYYLIESVLRKCNVKQLTRIELHTEGLSELTDGRIKCGTTEDAVLHASLLPRNCGIYTPRMTLKTFGKKHGITITVENGDQDITYDNRCILDAMKQEVEERFERRRALLRQSYSQIDKVKQDRRVIMDPNLRLPKKSTKTTPSWSTAAPKKKSLFEKARTEARKISPSSPPELPSKTIQMLREDAATTVRYDYPQGHAYRKPPDGGPQMKKAKVDGDYSWLEDDDDVRDDYQEDKHLKSKDQSRSKDSSKTPVSLEEAGRRFFEKTAFSLIPRGSGIQDCHAVPIGVETATLPFWGYFCPCELLPSA
ncbi:hypothetical protein BGZ54_006580 [Gamsiella multidivaricata]|nr:hypothetical protein BGZ54_006580 [Gamsiella multidivaricata]